MTDMDNRAQRIVARIGGARASLNGDLWFWSPGIVGYDERLTAEQFCRDGRVVLALMEKVESMAIAKSGNSWFCSPILDFTDSKGNESLAIAIEDACLDALEKSK